MNNTNTRNYEREYFELCLKAFPTQIPTSSELINEYGIYCWDNEQAVELFKKIVKGKKWFELDFGVEKIHLQTYLENLFTPEGVVYYLPFYLNLLYKNTYQNTYHKVTNFEFGWLIWSLNIQEISKELHDLYLKLTPLQARCVVLVLTNYLAYMYPTQEPELSVMQFWIDLSYSKDEVIELDLFNLKDC